ncbi:MAG: hypothetical protein ACUVRZ_08915, partial [Desulfobacca sp.]
MDQDRPHGPNFSLTDGRRRLDYAADAAHTTLPGRGLFIFFFAQGGDLIRQEAEEKDQDASQNDQEGAGGQTFFQNKISL